LFKNYEKKLCIIAPICYNIFKAAFVLDKCAFFILPRIYQGVNLIFLFVSDFYTPFITRPARFITISSFVCIQQVLSDRLCFCLLFLERFLSMSFSLCSLFAWVAKVCFLISLVLAAVSDLRHRSVPAHLERACYFFAVAGAFEKTLPLFILKLSGSVLCFLLFFIIYTITRGKGLGGADVRLFACSCAVFGFFPTLEAVLIGLSLGVVYALTGPRIPNTPKTTIPLISFFTLGCFISALPHHAFFPS